MRLKNKVAIITGAAGAIGAATTRKFLKEGASVVLSDFTLSDLEKVFGASPQDNIRFVAGDLTKKAVNEELVDVAQREFGGFDVFFANAGVLGPSNSLESYDVSAFDDVLDANVTSVLLGLQAALPKMRDGGSIILTSSIAGMMGTPMNVAYSTSKHAVIGLRRSAAYPAGKRGIRVNSLHPGAVDSPMTREATKRQQKHQATRPYDETQKIKGYVSVDDIANTVVFLGSDESCSMTDQAIVVDKGLV